MGLGINAGPVTAGDIGLSTKMENMVFADEVNIAAACRALPNRERSCLLRTATGSLPAQPM